MIDNETIQREILRPASIAIKKQKELLAQSRSIPKSKEDKKNEAEVKLTRHTILSFSYGLSLQNDGYVKFKPLPRGFHDAIGFTPDMLYVKHVGDSKIDVVYIEVVVSSFRGLPSERELIDALKQTVTARDLDRLFGKSTDHRREHDYTARIVVISNSSVFMCGEIGIPDNLVDVMKNI